MHGFIMLMIFNMRVRSNSAVCNSNVNRTDQAEQAVTLKMIQCNAHGWTLSNEERRGKQTRTGEDFKREAVRLALSSGLPIEQKNAAIYHRLTC